MPTEAEIEKRIDDEIAKAEAKYLGKLVRARSRFLPLVGVVTHVGAYGRDVDKTARTANENYGRIVLRLDNGTWRWLHPYSDSTDDWEVYDG